MDESKQLSARATVLFMLGAVVLTVAGLVWRAQNKAVARDMAIAHFEALGAQLFPGTPRVFNPPDWFQRYVPVFEITVGSAEYFSLQVAGASIGNRELELLAAISELQHVDLDSKNIDGDGLRHLSRLEQLSTLAIRNANITDVGLQQLRSCSQLKQLDLERTQVTAAGIAQFRTARPEVDVQWFSAALATQPGPPAP